MNANEPASAPGTAQPPEWVDASVNLADPRIGAKALACSDDFFAPMERMLQPGAPVFVPGKYDDHGKWMDGWESRRRRSPGHDWCVVALGVPGTLAGVDVDTRFFTGNYPPSISIDACRKGADPQVESSWFCILPLRAISGNSQHFLMVDASDVVVSHVRLNIFPDGGVARLRVYGRPSTDGVTRGPDGLVNLIALEHGGRPVAWNDAHFGKCENLLLPGRGVDMGDGWETRRRREPGNDWCVLALGMPGRVRRIEVDTAHFKGNYPDRCSLRGASPGSHDPAMLSGQSAQWPTLLPECKLRADAIHVFEQECLDAGVITHVRLDIYPDGGVSRLRLWGDPA